MAGLPTSGAGSAVPSHGGGDTSLVMAENDWTAALEETGHGVIRGLLDARECAAISALYEEPRRFRSKVVMAKHGFGRGEYQYFGHPLPEKVLELRRSLYPRLAPVANRWAEALGKTDRYPDRLEAYLERCHAAGQSRGDAFEVERIGFAAFRSVPRTGKR